jgi:hypothetical protein
MFAPTKMRGSATHHATARSVGTNVTANTAEPAAVNNDPIRKWCS